MPEIKKYRHGVPSWVDVSSHDIPRTVEFYATLFGWEGSDQGEEAGHYHLMRKGGLDVAGLGPAQPGQPAAWSTYIHVDDVDAVLSRVESAGGTVALPAMDVMEAGRMAFVADPAGAIVGLWQPNQHIGSRIVNEPATPVWHECVTRDLEGSKRFYATVLGWDYTAMDPEQDYQLCTVSGRPVCGMMPANADAPADIPSQWIVYFGVSDTDATARRATELGGAVLVEPFDTPVGRSAVLRDNTGATFSVITLSEESDPNEGWPD
jgi:predicted enzyme related to lactoylglutathione lyase